jgi:endonuclease/exonuclease/phosphatase family metal-dependent hydrolase
MRRSFSAVLLAVCASCTKPLGPDAGDAATVSDARLDGSLAQDAQRLDAVAVDAEDARDGATEMTEAGAIDAEETLDGDASADARDERESASDAAVTDVGASEDGATSDGAAGSRTIRVMSANLTAGNFQNYNPPPGDVAPGPGIRIMQGARPDIVLVQEMRYGADDNAAMQVFADTIMGARAFFCREVIDGAGDLPNGVVSRFPIVACGEWNDSRVSNRDYAYARIDVPGPVDLWAISVHLHTTASSRPIEGAELRDNIRMHIPAGDFVVLGGDLNTDTNMEPVFVPLNEVLAVQPQPTDQFGNPGTNANRLITLADGGIDTSRNKPYDWVIPSANLRALQRPVVFTDGVTTYTMPEGMVIDTRVFDAMTIAMIAPALRTDSAAPNMQHMGVIRDFALPLR